MSVNRGKSWWVLAVIAALGFAWTLVTAALDISEILNRPDFYVYGVIVFVLSGAWLVVLAELRARRAEAMVENRKARRKLYHALTTCRKQANGLLKSKEHESDDVYLMRVPNTLNDWEGLVIRTLAGTEFEGEFRLGSGDHEKLTVDTVAKLGLPYLEGWLRRKCHRIDYLLRQIDPVTPDLPIEVTEQASPTDLDAAASAIVEALQSIEIGPLDTTRQREAVMESIRLQQRNAVRLFQDSQVRGYLDSELPLTPLHEGESELFIWKRLAEHAESRWRGQVPALADLGMLVKVNGVEALQHTKERIPDLRTHAIQLVKAVARNCQVR